jgi:hypothetical protein
VSILKLLWQIDKNEQFQRANEKQRNGLKNQESVHGHEGSHTKPAPLLFCLNKTRDRKNMDEIT